MPKGYFTFFLHSHMPYVRRAGQHPHGEDMLHQTATETYIPLLNVLYDLRAEGVPFRLTIGITPVLAEQLADGEVRTRLETFLMEALERAEEDARRREAAAEGTVADAPAHHFLYLARFYADWYRNLLQSFRERFRRDLIGAFRFLQDENLIEITTSAATHSYLPLMARDSTIYAQLRTGVTSYLRHFGRLPRGIWLPECGYRPASKAEPDGEIVKPGLEAFLAELNLRYTFGDAHVVLQGRPLASATGDLAGALPGHGEDAPSAYRHASAAPFTPHPYYLRASNVAVYAVNHATGRQVWPPAEGYPGDFAYREFHRRDEHSGLPYWRITGDGAALGEKELYDPYHAFHRAREHAAHFVGVVRGQLIYGKGSGRPGIVVAAYNTGLFGHWWFEGIPWIREVMRLLSRDPDIALVTAGEYLDKHPPTESVVLPAGSWGKDGDHSTWSGPDTKRMWPLIHEAERRMEALVARFPDAVGERLELLKQAARELLLLESSDWPFLIGTAQAASYASDRFRQHLERFNRLAALVEKENLAVEERAFLQECQHLDNPFLNVDYRVFAEREGRAG